MIDERADRRKRVELEQTVSRKLNLTAKLAKAKSDIASLDQQVSAAANREKSLEAELGIK